MLIQRQHITVATITPKGGNDEARVYGGLLKI